MINVHKDSGLEMRDNDRYDDLDFTTGLREFKPPIQRPPDYRTVAVLIIGFAFIQVLLTVLASLWKTVYCWNDHYSTCQAIEDAEPLIMALFYGSGPVLLGVHVLMRIIVRYRQDSAVARRSGMVLDRFGDNIPVRTLERQKITYFENRYKEATKLQKAIAQYQLYKGINALSVSRHNDMHSDGTPLLEDMMSRNDWKAAVIEMPHLLIYGPSKAGKSTLAQAIVAEMDADYIVIDPLPNKPGEQKWGGIDFVTLQQGEDEWGAIGAALQAIYDEDKRRRQLLDKEVFKDLVVIIDEVLGLVASLGSEKVDGKNEPIMSRFIRLMGYSARHRHIKIILIGQGKNISDLGLDSGTARNNYALIRAQRNAATNERSAYIVTDDGEIPIDVREVLQLSQSISTRGSVWKTQRDMVIATLVKEDCSMPAAILQTPTRDEQATELFQAGDTIREVGKKLRAKGYTISSAELKRLKQEAS